MYIPLYGSLWAMAVCSDKLDPKAFTADEIDRRIEARKMQELRYYNGETHEGVFALPNFVRDLVTPARLKQPARGARLGVVRAAPLLLCSTLRLRAAGAGAAAPPPRRPAGRRPAPRLEQHLRARPVAAI